MAAGFFSMFKRGEDNSLHKLCQKGSVSKLREIIEGLTEDELAEKLTERKGFFGYTPLHEAVANGNTQVLSYLLHKTDGAHVNCTANKGFTLLHVAASCGQRDSACILLRNGADIDITNDNGKTPKQLAEYSSKRTIVRILHSEEVVKKVENNCDDLSDVLRYGADQLEPNCLDRSLAAATKNDHPQNIGKLIVKGASNVDHCIELAIAKGKPQSRAMLLMVKASITGNKSMIEKLFGDPVSNPDSLDPKEFDDDQFHEVQDVIITGKVSTVVPIEIARRNGTNEIREELLVKTDVNKDEGSVFWHGLRLLSLDIAWLRRISWVKRLRLARNGFRSLPPDMGVYLSQVVKLDLQHNELREIPQCLLELPLIESLNFRHNRLESIPDVPEWPPCLKELILASNELSVLPPAVRATGLKELDLSSNQFKEVPLCICSFVNLHTLNLSENREIEQLPVEMGHLGQLATLVLDGLDLRNPPKGYLRDPKDCIGYLKSKLDKKESAQKD